MIQDYILFSAINVLLAWSVYITLLSGSLSFASGGFMAFGAFGSGVATTKLAIPLLPAVVCTASAAALLGAAFSLPVLRTRGVYLILVTLGISVCMQSVIESVDYLGGVKGMGGLVGTELWHVLLLVLAVGGALWWLSFTPLQRVLDAVREDEMVARSLGINVTYVKVIAFATGCGLAAAAGALFAHYMVFITPEQFSVLPSVYIVLYVILGGMNNFYGPALGAVVMTLTPELLREFASWRPTIFGLFIVCLLLVRPQGLLSKRFLTVRFKAARRHETDSESSDERVVRDATPVH